MKTLQDVMPAEFRRDYHDQLSWRQREVEVEKEFLVGKEGWSPWPGTHKNVFFWVLLTNGLAVGWNESPSRGWSFPIVRYREEK